MADHLGRPARHVAGGHRATAAKERPPEGYVAAPTVHPGSQIEVDVATYENDDAPRPPRKWGGRPRHGHLGTSRAAVAIETALPDEDEYSVRVYDAERGRQLVAVIEIVSPGNKDRPDKRNAFVGKCAGLLRAASP
ncbi:MAG: hypothetical protein U0797_22605 [Gemmataceae bacterium]